jgi:hypothetical protein
MIFTEEQAEVILTNPKNLVNQIESTNGKLEIKEIKHNNGHKRTLPNEERVLIGTIARAGFGTNDEIAEEFGVTATTVNDLKHGRVCSPAHPRFVPHPELEEKILGKLNEVEEKAIDKLMASLGVITEEKLNECSAPQASVVASNMSKIVSNCRPQVQDNRKMIVMYAPRQKSLEDFNVVDV